MKRRHSPARARLEWLLLCLLVLGVVAFVGGCGEATDGDGQTEVAAEDGDKSKTEENGSKDDAEKDAESSDAEAADDGEDSKKKAKPRERSSTINAAKVFRGDLVVSVVAEGTIRARRRADVRSEISGRIERLFAEEGQQIKKGQKIATLDGREYRIAMEEAHSRYLNALGAIAVEEETIDTDEQSASFEDEMSELARLEARGKITREQRRMRELALGVEAMRGGTFRRELIEARSGLAQARADEERAKLSLSRTVIRAPFTGVLSNLTLTQGHHLTVGETVCSVIDNVDIEADVSVLESDLGGLEVGRPALLVVPALEETLRVKVDVISPEIDRDSRTCRVLMRIRSEDGHIRPGLFVRAAIAGKIYPDKLLVPNEAILTRDGRPLVFRVEDDRAKWVYVKLGLRNDRLSEIEKVLQGGPLDAGTLVVVSNHLTLSHDAKVKVKRVIDKRVAWSAAEPEG